MTSLFCYALPFDPRVRQFGAHVEVYQCRSPVEYQQKGKGGHTAAAMTGHAYGDRGTRLAEP